MGMRPLTSGHGLAGSPLGRDRLAKGQEAGLHELTGLVQAAANSPRDPAFYQRQYRGQLQEQVGGNRSQAVNPSLLEHESG